MDGAFHCAVVLQFASRASQSESAARSTTLASRRSSVYVEKCCSQTKNHCSTRAGKSRLHFHNAETPNLPPKVTRRIFSPITAGNDDLHQGRSNSFQILSPKSCGNKISFESKLQKKWGFAHNYYLRLFNMRAVIMRWNSAQGQKTSLSLSAKCRPMRGC